MTANKVLAIGIALGCGAVVAAAASLLMLRPL
jgi:hypothetical protein